VARVAGGGVADQVVRGSPIREDKTHISVIRRKVVDEGVVQLGADDREAAAVALRDVSAEEVVVRLEDEEAAAGVVGRPVAGNRVRVGIDVEASVVSLRDVLRQRRPVRAEADEEAGEAVRASPVVRQGRVGRTVVDGEAPRSIRVLLSFPGDEASAKPSRSFSLATLFSSRFRAADTRKMPTWKPLTLQFLTVTPVTLRISTPAKPGPMMLWPSQSRVMPSAAITIEP